MSLLNLFKLEKLTIHAYDDATRWPPAIDSMELMFNPTSYKMGHAVAYTRARVVGALKQPARFCYNPPSELSLQFVFDGTGVAFMGAEQIGRVIAGESVKKDIEKFQQLCLGNIAEKEPPRFLRIVWGNHLSFTARLKQLSINYRLFDEAGDPLRADLDASFAEDQVLQKVVRGEDPGTAKATQVVQVKSGDTLPMLCTRIYGSPSQYLRVAEENGLDDFRNLAPGQMLVFSPPPPATPGAKT